MPLVPIHWIIPNIETNASVIPEPRLAPPARQMARRGGEKASGSPRTTDLRPQVISGAPERLIHPLSESGPARPPTTRRPPGYR